MIARARSEFPPAAGESAHAQAFPIRLAMLWLVGLLSLATVAWGWTVIITHQLAAARTSDRMIELENGAKVQDGSSREFPATESLSGRHGTLQRETTT